MFQLLTEHYSFVADCPLESVDCAKNWNLVSRVPQGFDHVLERSAILLCYVCLLDIKCTPYRSDPLRCLCFVWITFPTLYQAIWSSDYMYTAPFKSIEQVHFVPDIILLSAESLFPQQSAVVTVSSCCQFPWLRTLLGEHLQVLL